ncbi:hypothetical protein HIMB100_00012370 [SAR116 cluster alpha proteobacterium HIMB100]|nr:hypothetical protein HIMB100_00012370 [SAR116 cluster alpha proteobacterium HIMB100]
MIIKFFCFCLLIFTVVSTSFADERISSDDDKVLARECYKTSTRGESSYSYWPAKIVEIDSSGATIKQIIRRKWHREKGGNNGWGEAKKYTRYEYHECFWHGVEKGKYNNRPSVVLVHWKTGELPNVYSYVEKSCISALCKYRQKAGFFEFHGQAEENTSFNEFYYHHQWEVTAAYENRKPSGSRNYEEDGHN